MSVTLQRTPQAHKLTETPLTATVTNAAGDATFTTSFPHSIAGGGEWIYIESPIESYNGFVWAVPQSTTVFKIQDPVNYIPFKQALNVTYYRVTLNHGWMCAHLPIAYQLGNDKFPLNSVDTSRTVSSYTDDNGFVNLNLSGSLGTFEALDYIQIIGSTSLDGVYQITSKTSSSDITINLDYDSGHSFSGAEVILYYKNYKILIDVYAGLPVGHYWEDERPYELVTTLAITPDDNNQVVFSINEILKGYLKIRNNLTLDTLPNNIDFWTAFYIEYAESYDVSDGTSITRYISTKTQDDFEGYAVNAELPFKNLYSGWMSEYVYDNTYKAKWLTLFERPIAVAGQYFDISFIKNVEGPLILNLNKNLGGVEITTEEVNFADTGIGVYRIPITADDSYDEYCVSMDVAAHSEEQEVTEEEEFDLSTWLNNSGDPGQAWTTGIPSPVVNIVSGSAKKLYAPYATTNGQVYTYNYEFTVANSDVGTKTIQLLFLDGSFLATGFSYIDVPGDGTYSGSVNITPSGDGIYIAINADSIGLQWDVTAVSVSTTTTYTETVEVPRTQITEEICIDIIGECEDTYITESNDNIRLTEDGDYRILE
jgi:hypothetical protein